MTKMRLTLASGEVWEFPASVVAKNRAEFFAERDLSTTYEEEYDYVIENHFELRDWAGNNMNWEDVASHAKQVNPAPAASADDFQDAWLGKTSKQADVGISIHDESEPSCR